MKLELKLTNDWIEATWYTKENEAKTQVHCEYFSGHPEHIAMLRAKALEYGTELDEAIVKELEESYEAPTQAELDEEANKAKLQEAYAYLASTDWITAKYNDVVTVLGQMSKADFVAKYREIYDNRTAARAVVGVE